MNINISSDHLDLSGIYIITNTINSKVYIGSSIKFRDRIAQHKSDLKNNKHNKRLQNFVNLYGIECLIFSILEIIENKDLLIEREQYWINFYQSFKSKKGYNICPVANSVLGIKMPQSHKDSCRRRMIGNTIKKGIPRKEISKKRTSEFWKNNPERLEEMKKKNRESQLKIDRTNVTKGKIIEVFFKNKKIDEMKQLKEVCKKYNLTHSCASKVLRGKQKETKGYLLKEIGFFYEN
jgi:group I intron endonuclease